MRTGSIVEGGDGDCEHGMSSEHARFTTTSSVHFWHRALEPLPASVPVIEYGPGLAPVDPTAPRYVMSMQHVMRHVPWHLGTSDGVSVVSLCRCQGRAVDEVEDGVRDVVGVCDVDGRRRACMHTARARGVRSQAARGRG